jgi:hypothetical protein
MTLALLFLLAAPECGSCHRAEAAAHASSSMAHALQRPDESRFLKENPDLRFSGGGYTYRIGREGDRSMYSVSSASGALSATIAWAFGSGMTGQTYLLERNGAWYETSVSFYPAIRGLDWTPGHATRIRADLDAALGRRLDAPEARRCFGCHSDAINVASPKPGVQCDHCHAGASEHAAAVARGDVKRAALRKLSALDTEELSELCSKCHPGWAEIATNGPRGVGNVRHQLYRLAGSKCYDLADKRIACTACHDPHRASVKQVSFYDAKCQACHQGAKTCPVAKQDCITCHMPKTEIPGLHFAFTDHRIRIARAGEKYPD